MLALIATLSLIFLSGCATQIHGPDQPPLATKRLTQYTQFEMTPVSIEAEYAGGRANQRALRKIEDNMFVEHGKVFPGIKRIARDETLTPRPGVLRIEPHIDAIKFVSGASRFFWGAWAGSSAVRVIVQYRDMGTGKIVDEPLFYSKANAYGGGWSMGATDNIMLLRVTQDIAKYSAHLTGREYSRN